MLAPLQFPHVDQDQEILFLDPEYNLLDVQTLNLENRPAIEAHAGRLTAEYGPVVVAVRLNLPARTEIASFDDIDVEVA